MDPQLMQQLRVDDPMEEPELNLDGLPISSIQVLLEPPSSAPEDDDDDSFYSPLDHFQNLVKLTMTNAQCQSLEGFPHLPLLQTLLLADNDISSGFEALAEADLQQLIRLDLTANKISDISVLKPLDALENLKYLYLAENDIADKDNYRAEVFKILPQLIAVDGLVRNGTEVEEQREYVATSSGNEEAQYSDESDGGEEDEAGVPSHGGKYHGIEGEDDEDDEEAYDDEENEDEYDQGPQGGRRPQLQQHGDESEDIDSEDEDEEEYDDEERYDSGSESEKENRPQMGGKTTGPSSSQGGEIDDDDELEEDEEDDEEEDEHEHAPQSQQQHHHHHHHQQRQQHYQSGDDEEEDLDEDEEEDEEEDLEEDEEDEEEEEEGPGLAYLLTEDIPSDNDEEFEPTNEVEEESEIESSDEDEYGGASKVSASTTNGSHPPKRPRSPPPPNGEGALDFDHGPGIPNDGSATGFDVDGEDANGFGMASFDGPATFDEESSGHDSKRQRT
ncbi:hypothetical protein BGZ83_010675 [Gryganskiella cystojenkinii]|nr:hypothetical protein BGZ83_010675 [Gryganskiella cystojenkinii]